MNDYQYKTLKLPQKNQGLFGYGGKPNKNGIGFTGRVIDSSGGFAGGSGGGIEGPVGPDGERGATGEVVPLPTYSDRGILWYNGEEWEALNIEYPALTQIITIDAETKTISYGRVIYGEVQLIVYRTEPPYNGKWGLLELEYNNLTKKIFGIDNGVFIWFNAEDCGCNPQ
jgi:hypothetical protein